jgi:serine/threonine-protein kinase
MSPVIRQQFPAEEPPSLTDLRPLENGRYRTLARLGHGGMAEVFLAVARGPAGFNKLVVIKRLKDELVENELHRVMFLDEARLAARLSHPNVVQTYEVVGEGKTFFITMEYLEGQALSALLRETHKAGIGLDPAFCAHVCSEVLLGLHYAHELCGFDGTPLRIVHRDVSPQNIFVTYEGQIKIVDFGIAKAELSSTHTQAGTFKGKVAYMAPEQFQGGGIDRRVDIFTTGIVLWEMITGARLMSAGNPANTLMRVLREPLPRVSEVTPNVDPELDAIVMKALERDPAARWQTAKEMRDALVGWMTRKSVPIGKEDVGRFMLDLFAAVRQKTQDRIKRRMAQLESEPNAEPDQEAQEPQEHSSLSHSHPWSSTPLSSSRILPLAPPFAPPAGRGIPLVDVPVLPAAPPIATLGTPAPPPQSRAAWPPNPRVAVAFGIATVAAIAAVFAIRGGATSQAAPTSPSAAPVTTVLVVPTATQEPAPPASAETPAFTSGTASSRKDVPAPAKPEVRTVYVPVYHPSPPPPRPTAAPPATTTAAPTTAAPSVAPSAPAPQPTAAPAPTQAPTSTSTGRRIRSDL